MSAAPTHAGPITGTVRPADRPALAMIHVVPTPYWMHLHRRIDREIPGLRLFSLYTYDVPDQPWVLDAAADVRPVRFGDGDTLDMARPIRSLRRDLEKSGKIIRWLRRERPAAVIVCGYNDIGRLRILRWCRARNIPCFLSADSNIHGDRATGIRRIVKRLVVPAVIRRCTGVMPFGSAGERYFLRYGAAPDRVFRIPAEPDYTAIETISAEEIARTAARFGLERGRRRILFCGRLIPLKRIDLLISAFEALSADRPEWDLAILGDGELRAALEASVPGVLRQRVIWTGFLSDERQIAGVYRSCDVLALTSETEAWALVVNEALAAGLAVVTSDVVGAADDLVRPGVNGRTFKSGDAGSLRDALLEVTQVGAVDRMRAASARVLAEWRERADPVQGVRNALKAAGVL